MITHKLKKFWAPAVPAEAFLTFWRFAVERQNIFLRKQQDQYPLTSDRVLLTYKFTNAYRILDRVSQYLVKEVIYNGNKEPDDTIFRILLFKMFNKVETWELISDNLSEITLRSFQIKTYDRLFSDATRKGAKLFSGAYIMPSGSKGFEYSKKYRSFLHLIQYMMKDNLPKKIRDARSMREGFSMLRSYPMIGDFLAYQFITDINYSEAVSFSETEFVVPGPGALSGIRKCFKSLGGLSEIDIIQLAYEMQDLHFEALGLKFPKLQRSHELKYIDIQNLFCEVDKYTRVVHPEIKGIGNRKRLKRVYRNNNGKLNLFFPPKWNLR